MSIDWRRHATTIVLGALCVVMTIWLFVDRNTVGDDERKRREHNVFPAWRRDDLTRIEIVKGLEKLVLVRDAKKDSTWKMTSPREERTDFAAVEKLLMTLEFATVARKAGDGALGFDEPRATGTIEMKGLSLRFVLGGPSPRPEGSSYFRVNDEPPIVVSKELTEVLLASADTYRTRSVVPYLSTEIQKLEVKDVFVLDRVDDRLFSTGGLLASREEVDKIWNAMAELRAEAFPSDADADRLTAEPALTILMKPKDPGAPVGELRIGGECPGEPNDVVVLRVSPTRLAACAPRGAAETLKEAGASLVMKRPFSFRADEIEELRLERVAGEGPGPAAIELARKGSGFHEREPVDRELPSEEADAANALVTAIERMAATKVTPRGERPWTPTHRAKVRVADREEVVEVALQEGDAVSLRRAKDDAILEVSRANALALVPRETSLKPRTLVSDARRVTRVVLRCGVPQELADRGKGFELVEPAGYEADSSIGQLVDGITRGRVDRWVADDGAFGISPEGCRVVLAFEDGNAPVTVRFGAEDHGSTYGKVDGSPHVFSAGAALPSLARSIYVSRASLRVDPSLVASVRVTSSSGAAVKGPSALRDAIGMFIAERVLSLGEPEVGTVDLTIDVTVADGGAPRRIVCGPADAEGLRKCASADVRAVFSVSKHTWGRLFQEGDGGNVARDAGPR